MIPAHLDKNWLDGNFSIPSNEVIRDELRKELVGHSRNKELCLPAHRKIRAELLARTAATEVLAMIREMALHTPAQKHDIPLPRHLFTKTWLESGLFVPSDNEQRADLRDTLSGYLNIGETWFPGNEKTRRKIKAYIAAIDAVNAEMS